MGLFNIHSCQDHIRKNGASIVQPKMMRFSCTYLVGTDFHILEMDIVLYMVQQCSESPVLRDDLTNLMGEQMVVGDEVVRVRVALEKTLEKILRDIGHCDRRLTFFFGAGEGSRKQLPKTSINSRDMRKTPAHIYLISGDHIVFMSEKVKT